MPNPFQVVKDFESALCEYTRAPYAVTTNSCTMALLLAMTYEKTKRDTETGELSGSQWVELPKRTYVGVAMAAKLAGMEVHFADIEWEGAYTIPPTSIVDSARYFSSHMYSAGYYQCVSFHTSKILGDSQGGAILHDNPEADKWFRKARFDGRTEGVHPKDDVFDMLGYHCYMSPDIAARLLHKLSVLPKHNDPLPNDQYPDLSKFEVFNG